MRNHLENLTINQSRLIMEGIQSVFTKRSSSSSPLQSPSPKKRITNFHGITPIKSIETPTNRPFRVSIEGNIGAGKSTLIKYFEKFPCIETYSEPLDHWRNVNGHNLLELMYTDINKWLKVFQSYVQLTRLKVQTSKPKDESIKVQLFERSIQNARFCFVECAYNSGFLHGADYEVLDEWYRWIRLNMDIELDLIVYLRSTPEIVYERMKARGRPEENSVSLDYLKDLHENHEKWLMTNNERFNTVPVLVMDADKTLNEIYEQYKLHQDKILGHDIENNINNISKVKKNLDLNS